MYAGGAEEALKQLAAAGLSQRCGTLGPVASGVGRHWPVQEGLPRRNGRREVGDTNVFYRVLVYPNPQGFKVQTGSKPSRLPVQSSSDEAARQEETTPRQPARARSTAVSQ